MRSILWPHRDFQQLGEDQARYQVLSAEGEDLDARNSPEIGSTEKWTLAHSHKHSLLTSLLLFSAQVSILVGALYLALRLSVLHAGWQAAPPQLETNSFLPAHLRQAPFTTVEFSGQTPYDGYNAESDLAWDNAMPKGRGYIIVQSPERYALRHGKDVQGSLEASYGIAAFHSMHCLGVLREILYASMEQPLGLDYRKPAHGGFTLSHHIDHCISYLRQYIMCAADPTVESLAPVLDSQGDIHYSDEGWGNVHMCRSWDALKEYANLHAANNNTGTSGKDFLRMAAKPGAKFRGLDSAGS